MIKRVDTEFLPEGTKTLEELHHAIADGDQALLGQDSAGRQDLRMPCRRWPVRRGPYASWWTICNDT